MKRIGLMQRIGLVAGIIGILIFAVWKTSIDASAKRADGVCGFM